MLSAASLLLVKEEENALPWRLTPICHSSSITDHLAAPELGCRLQPAPPRHARTATPGRRANKFNASFSISTHWRGSSGALRKNPSR